VIFLREMWYRSANMEWGGADRWCLDLAATRMVAVFGFGGLGFGSGRDVRYAFVVRDKGGHR